MLVLRRSVLAIPGLLALPVSAQQAWPTKPLRIIVPFPAGQSTDILGRVTAEQLGKALGQQVIVENRPGAGGSIGADVAAKSAPDGYTVGFGHIGGLVISPAIQKVPYDPLKSFAPIGLMVTLQNIIITPLDQPQAFQLFVDDVQLIK